MTIDEELETELQILSDEVYYDKICPFGPVSNDDIKKRINVIIKKHDFKDEDFSEFEKISFNLDKDIAVGIVFNKLKKKSIIYSRDEKLNEILK